MNAFAEDNVLVMEPGLTLDRPTRGMPMAMDGEDHDRDQHDHRSDPAERDQRDRKANKELHGPAPLLAIEWTGIPSVEPLAIRLARAHPDGRPLRLVEALRLHARHVLLLPLLARLHRRLGHG